MDQDKQDGQKNQYFVKNAKQIIHVMEESIKTVAALQNSLTVDEDQFSKLENIFQDIKDVHDENTVNLDICDDDKEHPTEDNKTFLDFLQLIYSACQGLYRDIIKHNDELQEVEDLLIEKVRLFSQEHNESKLVEEFQQVEQQKEEIDLLMIQNEKKELQLKIEEVKSENDTLRTVITAKKALLKARNTKVSQDIDKFTKIVSNINQKYLKLANKIETGENKQISLRTLVANFVNELDIKIAELAVDAQRKIDMLNDAHQINQNIQNLLKLVKLESIYTNEKHQKHHIELLLEMQQKIKETGECADKKIKTFKSLIADFKRNFVAKKNFVEQLCKEYYSLQQQIDNIYEKIADMEELSELQAIPNMVLKIEPQCAEIRSFTHILEEGYKVDKKNYDEIIKQANLELSKLENNIKLQKRAVKDVEWAISKYKNELNTMNNENKETTITLIDINEEIKLLKLKHEKQQKSTRPPEMTKSKRVKCVEASKKPSRNSDSNMDLVDRPALVEIGNKRKHKEQLQKKNK